MLRYIFILMFFHFSSVVGGELKHCYIKDQNKHANNQKLLKTIIDEELATHGQSMQASEKANFLAIRISLIAKELIKKGFSAEAYAIPYLNSGSIVTFDCFTLWEGEKDAIPLSFYMYIWPPVELALRYQDKNAPHCYASIIHSHPIPCAFSVLQGTLIQKKYEVVDRSRKHVRCVSLELFDLGKGEYDDLKQLSIHKLYTKGTVCLSLHAYGVKSSEDISKCFGETLASHIYYE